MISNVDALYIAYTSTLSIVFHIGSHVVRSKGSGSNDVVASTDSVDWDVTRADDVGV